MCIDIRSTLELTLPCIGLAHMLPWLTHMNMFLSAPMKYLPGMFGVVVSPCQPPLPQRGDDSHIAVLGITMSQRKHESGRTEGKRTARKRSKLRLPYLGSCTPLLWFVSRVTPARVAPPHGFLTTTSPSVPTRPPGLPSDHHHPSAPSSTPTLAPSLHPAPANMRSKFKDEHPFGTRGAPPANDPRSSAVSCLQRNARQRRSVSGRSTRTGYPYVELPNARWCSPC